MRVVHEVLSPRMKDDHEANPCAKVFWVIGKLHERLNGRQEQEIVHALRIYNG